MTWLIIISSILAAAFILAFALYFIMTRLVRWMDEVEREKERNEDLSE